MRRLRPLLVAAVSVAAVLLLFVVLRPNDESDETETGTAKTTSTTRTATSATTATKPPLQTRTRFTIAVREGQVIGGIRRMTFPRGARLELFVTADVADEVHLHGYDLSEDVAPGAPARVLFSATTSGRFEVELERRDLQIAEITVQP